MLLGGLALLIAGANFLVRGASSLAKAVGISPLVVGLTIVAFGTSSPELAIATSAAVSGKAELAVGNVVGSNIANVLLILGLASVIAPLTVKRRLIRFDVPFMIAMSLLMYVMAANGTFERWEGVLLLSIAVAYTWFLVRQSRRQAKKEAAPDEESTPGRAWLNAVLIAGGLVMLILGSNLLVTGATNIARAMDVSELIVGLTIVAVGTSSPEIATTVMAAIKGQREMAIGAVIGSNVYNIVLVLGVASSIAPDAIRIPPSAMNFDIPVMVAVAVACLPVFFSGFKIVRWEGAMFLAYYAAYIAYLIMGSQHHKELPMFNFVLTGFVLPLTVLTIVALSIQTFIKFRRHGPPDHY
ncbi:MAG: calcium/sodium antiporter [Armatimonadetes bacterium]|nr:calcium/sodium antiporter [Armatimonadota bacterium]